MKTFSIFFLCLAFTFTPFAARADPPRTAPVTMVAPSQRSLPVPAPVNNLSGDYEKREATNPLLESFQGSGNGLYIGSGAVTVLIIVLLVVLIVR